MIRRFLTVCMLLAITMLAMFGTSAVLAQDATPVAECVAPELPPGTPTPMDEGSPVAEEAAPPDAQAVEEESTNVEGPARPQTVEEAQAGLDNVLACIASGDFLSLAGLMTPNFVPFVTETGNVYDVPLAMEGAGPMTVVATGEAVGDQDHRIGLHLIFSGLFNDPGTLSSERWYLVKDGDFWKVDEIVPVPVPDDFAANYTVVEVAMVDFAFSIGANEIPAGPVILRFTNTSYTHSPHVAGIVILSGDLSAEQVIQMDALPPDDQIEAFVGGTFVEPGQTGDLIFQDLAAGSYTMVCDFLTPDGVEHWQLGMVAQFDVV
jgi:hypothetical protein